MMTKEELADIMALDEDFNMDSLPDCDDPRERTDEEIDDLERENARTMWFSWGRDQVA